MGRTPGMVGQGVRFAELDRDVGGLQLAVIQRADGREDVVGPNGLVRLARSRVVLRLLLAQSAVASLGQAVLNIMVPEACGIEPFGRPRNSNVTTSRTSQLVPGSVVWAKTFIAELDGRRETPIRHHAVVTLPGPGRWPVLALVAGDSPVGWSSRAVLEFVPRAHQAARPSRSRAST